MSTLVGTFLNDENGQDLVEYSLLLAFVALASAALFAGAGDSVEGIWSQGNRMLLSANSTAGGKHTDQH